MVESPPRARALSVTLHPAMVDAPPTHPADSHHGCCRALSATMGSNYRRRKNRLTSDFPMQQVFLCITGIIVCGVQYGALVCSYVFPCSHVPIRSIYKASYATKANIK